MSQSREKLVTDERTDGRTDGRTWVKLKDLRGRSKKDESRAEREEDRRPPHLRLDSYWRTYLDATFPQEIQQKYSGLLEGDLFYPPMIRVCRFDGI